MLASPLLSQTSANPFGVYHSNREGSETCFSHFRSGTVKLAARCQNKRKSSRDSGVVQHSLSEEKKFFLSIEIYAISWKCELTELDERELLKQNCLKPKITRGGFLRNKKIICCLKLQLELDKQELRDQCADRALHESGMQLQSQRMELYHANQLSDHSQREKSWPHTELDRKERLLPEDRMRSLQEIQELKKCAVQKLKKQIN